MIPPERERPAAKSSAGNALFAALLVVAVALSSAVFGVVGFALSVPIAAFALFVGRTKACPQCGERVKHAAKVCRFCRAQL
jgi:hypothetical protein